MSEVLTASVAAAAMACPTTGSVRPPTSEVCTSRVAGSRSAVPLPCCPERENEVARAEKSSGMVTTAAYRPARRPASASAASVSTQPKLAEEPLGPAEPDEPDEPAEAGGPVDQIMDDMIRLRSHLTGLPQVVWLRRGHGDENILVGVTPGARLDTERLTVLMVEPIVMQVSGGLGQGDFDRVSAWVMANRDLIDDFWEGHVASFEELRGRVQRLRALAMR